MPTHTAEHPSAQHMVAETCPNVISSFKDPAERAKHHQRLFNLIEKLHVARWIT